MRKSRRLTIWEKIINENNVPASSYSPEYLFLAAYFADKVLKNSEEAISLFRKLKEKYPNTEKGFEADKYLAQLGVYKGD